jgi:antitoxin component YwqK of YwqJK toxin-antitoxin module
MKGFFSFILLFGFLANLSGQENFSQEHLKKLLSKEVSSSETAKNKMIKVVKEGISSEDAISLLNFISSNIADINADLINEILNSFHDTEGSFIDLPFLNCLFEVYPKFRKDSQVILFHLLIIFEFENQEAQINRFLNAFGDSLLYINDYLPKNEYKDIKSIALELAKHLSNENIKFSIYKILITLLESKQLEIKDVESIKSFVISDFELFIEKPITQKSAIAKFQVILVLIGLLNIEINENNSNKIINSNVDSLMLAMIEILFSQNKPLANSIVKKLVKNEINKMYFYALCERYPNYSNFIDKTMNQEEVARGKLQCWFYENLGIAVATNKIIFKGFHKIEEDQTSKIALFECTLNAPYFKEELPIACSGGVFIDDKDLGFHDRDSVGTCFSYWPIKKIESHVLQLREVDWIDHDASIFSSFESQSEEESSPVQSIDFEFAKEQSLWFYINKVLEKLNNFEGITFHDKSQVFTTTFNSSGQVSGKFSIENNKTNKLEGEFSVSSIIESFVLKGMFRNGVVNGKLEMTHQAEPIKIVFEIKDQKLILVKTYEADKLKGQMPFSNELLNGTLVSYFPSGQKEVENNFLNGKRNGTSTTYSESGKILSQGRFKNGRPVGAFMKYYENGNLKTKLEVSKDWNGLVYSYFPSGELKMKSQIKNKILNGSSNVYFISGKREGSFTYVDSQLDGLVNVFYENGTLKSQTNYNKGIRQGKEKHFHENGKLKFEIVYLNDQMHGECLSYYEDGVIQNKAMFSKNVPEGSSFQYNRNGVLVAQAIIEGGELKEGTSYDENASAIIIYKDFKPVKKYLIDHKGERTKEISLYEQKSLDYLKNIIRVGNIKFLKKLNTLHPGILEAELDNGQNSLHKIANLKPDLMKCDSELIDLYVDISKQDNDGNSALHLAIQMGNINLIELLLSRKPSLFVENNEGRSIIEGLLCNDKIKLGSDIDDKLFTSKLKNGQNLLHLAAKCNQVELVKKCLLAGIDINSQDLGSNTALNLAHNFKNSEVAKLLFISGAKTNIYDLVCLGEMKKLQEELTAKPEFLDKPDFFGNTLIHYSITHGQLEAFKFLLKTKSDLKVKNRDGFDPIMLSVVYNQPQMIEMLLSTGLLIPEQFGENRFAVFYMVKNGMLSLLQKYIEKGFTLKIQIPEVANLLFVAVENNQENVAAYLIEKGIAVNEKNQNNETCIQIASKNKNKNIYILLQKNGGIIEVEDAIRAGDLAYLEKLVGSIAELGKHNRSDLLTVAIEANQIEVVKFLINKGLDINAKSRNSKSPLELSLTIRNQEIAELLIENGADDFDIQEEDKIKNWLLASENGFTKVLLLMVEKGLELNSPSIPGALEEFVTRGYFDVVEKALNTKGLIYTEALQKKLTGLAEKPLDQKMVDLLKNKLASSTTESESEQSKSEIYEVNPNKKNIKEGRFKVFNVENILSKSGNYHNNLLEGPIYDLMEGDYNRFRYSISNYKAGKLNGLTITYSGPLGGKVSEIECQENFLNDKLNGISLFYNIFGVKTLEINYENGLKHGPLKEWLNGDQIISDLEFKKGEIWQGFVLLKEEENIEEKEFTNYTFSHYLENCHKVIKWEFENGKLIGKKSFLLKSDHTNIVVSGLEWIGSSQETSGCWDPGKYEGESTDQTKRLSTAFCLLTFLGAGHTDRAGKYKKNVKIGIQWLISEQQKDGSFASDNSINGICTWALAEAAGMGCGGAEVKNSAIKACQFVLNQQNVSGGFNDYGKSENLEPGEYDKMAPTAWCVMGLKSAGLAGILEDKVKISFNKAKQLFENTINTKDNTLESKGHAWYHAGGDTRRSSNGELYQAMALLIKQYLGAERTENWYQAAVKELSSQIPKDENSIDFLHGLFLNYSLFQAGWWHL